MWLRKNTAGATSTGYVWPVDGAVVLVDDDHAAELLAIPDGDFSAAEAPAKAARVEVTEPAPAPAAAEAVTEPRPRRRTSAKD